MSTPAFPSLATSAPWLQFPGIAWEVGKEPNFTTGSQETKTGRESAIIYQARPRWRFSFVCNVLRDQYTLARNASKSAPYNEFQTFLAFCLSRYGRGSPFFITDPTDHFVTGQTIMASATAGVTDFQMVRTFGQGTYTFTEPVGGVNTIDTIVVRIDGTPTALYTANVPYDGWIRFNSAPGAGKVITADFSYYHKVSFEKDALSFATHLVDRWENRSIGMRTRWP